MEIKQIYKKEIWENFLVKLKEKTFLQSWDWGEFQEKTGNKIWRLGIFDQNQLVGVVLIAGTKAKRGSFLLIQHGPVLSAGKLNVKQEKFKALLEEFKKIAIKEKADFIRIAPLWERNKENQEIFKKMGFRESPMHANAYESTWKLDLARQEEDILANMRKTTRYLIRQVMKNQDVVVEKSESPDCLKAYQDLNKTVAKRQKFVPFSPAYIENEFEVFSKDKKIALFLGKYRGEVDSAALVVFWQNIGFYHQAASSLNHPKLSIPYLILWEAIKEAKKRNCFLFDFWGYVDPKENPGHPWSGPSLFKTGFGGKSYQYLKTQDFPVSKKYWLISAFEKIRKIKRGL